MTPFTELSWQNRLEAVPSKTCRPLPDAKTAITFALERFHETWQGYRTITPTLYPLRDGPGTYLTLGGLRRSYGLTWPTLDALLEALDVQRELTGYLLATEAVGGTPLHFLFALQGHERGERHYGALNLSNLTPFEQTFTSEPDAETRWQALRLEARSSAVITRG